jgi:hypothetical protein
MVQRNKNTNENFPRLPFPVWPLPPARQGHIGDLHKELYSFRNLRFTHGGNDDTARESDHLWALFAVTDLLSLFGSGLTST